MPISARNKLRGTIEEVDLGDIMAHVVVRVGDNLSESAITRRCADESKLKKGDTVFAVVKSTEVMIQKIDPSFNAHYLQCRDRFHPACHPLFIWYDDSVRPFFCV
jgi:molybdopterin-binding protein